jgi:hypothetical protein
MSNAEYRYELIADIKDAADKLKDSDLTESPNDTWKLGRIENMLTEIEDLIEGLG